MARKESYFDGVIKAFGLVFGDIGTSPIYTLTVIFLLLKPTEENVIGVLSLRYSGLLQSLSRLNTYGLRMGLSKKGEGEPSCCVSF